MKIMMRAVESINTPIDFGYIRSRFDSYASSIKQLDCNVSISCGNAVRIQEKEATWYNTEGIVYKREKLSDSSTSQQWFADIEIDNCECPLSERLKKSPWNDGKMIVFELAPIDSVKGDN